MAHNFSVGDKVFLRSNEPDQPLIVGRITRFEDYGGKCSTPLAVVKDDKTGLEFLGGYVCEYSSNLHSDLENLLPIEQWNYLMAGKFDGFQIAEKYGVKYKTFK